MVKIYVGFKNSLFVWVYLKQVCFLGIVLTWLLFGKIVTALHLWYFLNSFFYQNLFSLLWNATCFVFTVQNINLFFIKTIIFNIKQFNISMDYNLNFLSNSINEFNSSKKRIKRFEYFWQKIANNGILFLQETHFSHDTVINWRDDFKGELFFSHAWGVMIEYLGSKKIKVNRIKKR